MPQRDIVVIGASAGGLRALVAIVTRLPASLPACLLVVMPKRALQDVEVDGAPIDGSRTRRRRNR